MRGWLLKTLLFVLVMPARADFKASGDAQVTGQVGVGTTIPRATFEVRMSSLDAYGLLVSSKNGTALLLVDKTGKMAIGLRAPRRTWT